MRCRHRWTLVLIACAASLPVATARADDVGPPAPDPAGDCPASACADLTAVATGLKPKPDGRLTFSFTAVRPWFDFGSPPPRAVPQVSVWTTSPDTGPPDATITAAQATIVGGPSFAVHTTDLVYGEDYYGATTRIEFAIGEDDVPSFLTALGGPFRWRATLPGDAVPNTGSIAFAPPDADADGLPDSVDPCPASAFSEPARGWTADEQRDGCAARVAPFTAAAFKKTFKKAGKAFRALWRNHKRRAAAMRRERIDLRLRVPAGRGRVDASVTLRHPDAPRPPSVYGGRKCAAGRCVVRMKLVPEGVRAYRRKALILSVYFTTGRGHNAITIGANTPLRMPL
jgi:hypothetical protein